MGKYITLNKRRKNSMFSRSPQKRLFLDGMDESPTSQMKDLPPQEQDEDDEEQVNTHAIARGEYSRGFSKYWISGPPPSLL